MPETAAPQHEETDPAHHRQSVTGARVTAEHALGVERIDGTKSVRARAEAMACASSTELDVAVLVPHDAGSWQAGSLLGRPPTATTLKAKVLYHASARNDSAAMAQAARLATTGYQVCTTLHLPPVLMISDQQAALIALDPAQPSRGAICVREPVIVAFLTALFRSAWKTACPLQAASDRPELSAQERALLRYLAAGLTVETAARRLGISVRTAGRLVSTMMVKLGATSRLQAGFEAARRGWLL